MTGDPAGGAAEAVGPGRRLGNLLVEREIGRGGFSTVYQARDVLIGRPVALKVLRPPAERRAPDDRDRVLSEARIVGALRSPRIVTLYGVHELPEGAWAFEMEFLDGGTLHDRIRAGRGLPAEEAVPLLRAVLEGLEVAHGAGVLHRDLKPHNVLLGRDGSVKLADFGLARLVEGAVLHMHSTGRIEGTPWYMAPELLMREPATAASDLWSVGVLAYEMLTGRVAFDESDLPSLFYVVQNARPKPLGERVPRGLALLISRCLEKRPADRPGSAKELLDLIDRSTASLPAAVMERAAFAAAAARMAGRGKETTRMDSLLPGGGGGGAAAVLVTGEGGGGKSALLREIRLLADQRGFGVVEAHVTTTEGPLRPLLRAALGGKAPGPEGGKDLSPMEARGQTLHALEQALGGLAAARPLCIVVDDLHLAREEDVHLLHGLRRRLDEARILLALGCRTDSAGMLPRASASDRGASALAEAQDIDRIHLEPLAPEALYRVLEARALARIPPEVAARIAEHSGGNPLLALELLRHLEESGGLVREDTAFRTAPGWEAVPLPQRFREIVELRLAGLSDEERALLEAAAVDGLDFDGQALAAATGEPLIEILRRLQRLVRRGGIVRPREGGYRFAHAAVRDVLLDSIGPELRGEIHRALAGHLSSRTSPVDPARLAYHWKEAGEPGTAAPLFLRAVAARRHEFRRAGEFWDEASAWVAGLPAEALLGIAPDLIRAGWILPPLGRGGEAERLFARVLDAATRTGGAELEGQMRVELALLHSRRKGMDASDEEHLLRAAEAEGPPAGKRGQAAYAVGLMAKRRGDLGTARKWYLRAQADFSALRAEESEAQVIMELGSVSLRRGEKVVAEGLYGEAARLYQRLGAHSSAAVAEVNRVRAAKMRGVLEGLDEVLESAVRTLSLEGNRNQAAHAGVVLAETLYSLGRLDAALATVETSVATLRETGYLPGLAGSLVAKVYLCTAAGRTEEALAAAAEARGVVDRHGDNALAAELAAVEAQALCLAGRMEEATAAASRALERQRATTESPAGTTACLAEAVLLGLSPRLLEDAEVVPPGEDPVAEALRAGALAMADPSGPAPDLERAAAVLGGEGVGDARAAMQVLARWMRAEGCLRREKPEDAEAEAAAALAAARNLGHAGYEAGIRRLLERIRPSPESRPTTRG